MCLSRIHRVVGAVEGGRVTVLDLDGHERSVSLLAYDGLPPKPGTGSSPTAGTHLPR